MVGDEEIFDKMLWHAAAAGRGKKCKIYCPNFRPLNLVVKLSRPLGVKHCYKQA